MKSDEKKRMSYDKPAVVFEKNLEALAADCDPTGGGTYTGGVTGYCKADGACIVLYS
jgi:hypothetical protein